MVTHQPFPAIEFPSLYLHKQRHRETQPKAATQPPSPAALLPDREGKINITAKPPTATVVQPTLVRPSHLSQPLYATQQQPAPPSKRENRIRLGSFSAVLSLSSSQS